jgi:hypothetical protein
MRKPLCLLLVLILPAAALGFDVDDPPAGKFSDEWFALMIAGKKSGHMHATMERLERPSGDVIRTRTEMRITATRGEIDITLTLSQQTEESLAGEPLSFSSRLALGRFPSTTEGRFKNGKVTITTRQLGIKTDENTYDLPEGAKMSWGVYREQIDRGLEPGTRYQIKLYEPSIAPDRLTSATMEVLGRETLDLFGRKVEAIKTIQTMSVPGLLGQGMDLTTTTWLTEEGEAVRMRMKVMDFPIEVIACSKAVATAKDEPAELMASTLISADRPVDARAKTLTFRMEWDPAGKSKLGELPETPMQKVERRETDSVTFTNTRRSARTQKQSTGKLSEDERARYLAASGYVNHKDPKVAELAREAAGDEKDPAQLADRLRRFVSDYVQSKNLNVGFATASEVARSREGDCTEHGILLAALGRAMGIPTRVVTGLVYTDEFLGRRHIFVGHLWTQFWLDGEWVDLDAALHQTDVDPTHIALAVSDAGEAGLADLAGSVWLNMGKPRIRVVDPK